MPIHLEIFINEQEPTKEEVGIMRSILFAQAGRAIEVGRGSD